MTRALPSVATFCSLSFGILAIILLSSENFFLAALLISLGSLLDLLDGQLARRLKTTSAIGKELDSLSDMVTFGVAPAMLIYHLLLLVGVAQSIAILTSLIFVWAGAFRLARFNTLPPVANGEYVGLPIPVASFFLVSASFWQQWILHLWWTLAVIFVSYLMVSIFPYPKKLSIFPPKAWFFAVIIAIAWGFLAGWQAVPFGVISLYVLSGPLRWFYAAHRRRKALS